MDSALRSPLRRCCALVSLLVASAVAVRALVAVPGGLGTISGEATNVSILPSPPPPTVLLYDPVAPTAPLDAYTFPTSFDPDPLVILGESNSTVVLRVYTADAPAPWSPTLVSFQWDFYSDLDVSHSAAGYYVNDVSTTLLNGVTSGTITALTLQPGDKFGFFVSSDLYSAEERSLTVSWLHATQAAAIPEPAATALGLGLVAAGGVLLRRRR